MFIYVICVDTWVLLFYSNCVLFQSCLLLFRLFSLPNEIYNYSISFSLLNFFIFFFFRENRKRGGEIVGERKGGREGGVRGKEGRSEGGREVEREGERGVVGEGEGEVY